MAIVFFSVKQLENGTRPELKKKQFGVTLVKIELMKPL